MSNTFQHKRGDTFDLSGPVQVTDSGAEVSDFTGWGIACQLRRPDGVLVATLQASWLNPIARLMRVRATNTAAWPLGMVEMDVQLTTPTGDVVSTPTERFEVVREVTRGVPGA